jgi:hypothetical protein
MTSPETFPELVATFPEPVATFPELVEGEI